MEKLNRSKLNIKELNLSSPLCFSRLKSLKERYKFDFDVYLPSKGINLQRDLVWSLEQKQQLILSVFKERIGSYNSIKMIPPLSAVQHEYNDGSKVYQIIDGKQRLSTLFAFMDNEFYILVDNECYFYNDLSDDLKGIIDSYYPLITVKYSYDDEPVSDQDKIDWFEMINYFGTPLEVEHLNKLKTNGK